MKIGTITAHDGTSTHTVQIYVNSIPAEVLTQVPSLGGSLYPIGATVQLFYDAKLKRPVIVNGGGGSMINGLFNG